jgi:hypothetical protein
MTRLLKYLFLIFPLVSYSQQQKLIIKGHVTETYNDSVIEIKDSKVYIESSPDKYVLTNRDGEFELIINYAPDKVYTLIVSDVRYDAYKYSIKKREIKRGLKDTLRLEINLSFQTLGAATVTGIPVETVFGSDKLNVSDFEFMGEENFIMLVYEQRLNKSSKLIYTDKKGTILSSYEVLDLAKEFYRDFMGNLFLVCVNDVFEMKVEDDILSLTKTDKKFFEDQIKPWVDTTNYKAYYSNFVSFYPAFDYYAYSTIDSSITKLTTVVDKPLMELYRAQYKYLSGHDKLESVRMEMATGIDKEIWAAVWSGFPNSLYYKQLYAPMFVKNDTILIFDHYKNKMFRYDRNNHVIDSLDISYHNSNDKREWEELLVQDRNKQRIFSVFLRGGKYYLKELNTTTGEITKVHPLYYKYPEKLKVKNGYAYYIYRPFESLQNKYLYREKLN